MVVISAVRSKANNYSNASSKCATGTNASATTILIVRLKLRSLSNKWSRWLWERCFRTFCDRWNKHPCNLASGNSACSALIAAISKSIERLWGLNSGHICNIGFNVYIKFLQMNYWIIILPLLLLQISECVSHFVYLVATHIKLETHTLHVWQI